MHVVPVYHECDISNCIQSHDFCKDVTSHKPVSQRAEDEKWVLWLGGLTIGAHVLRQGSIVNGDILQFEDAEKKFTVGHRYEMSALRRACITHVRRGGYLPSQTIPLAGIVADVDVLVLCEVECGYLKCS